MVKLPYVFKTDADGNIAVNESESTTIKIIFKSYVAGNSLGKIADLLLERQIPSMSGKITWTRSALDNLLSNGKYVPHIISMEKFIEVQTEKANRCNVDYNTGKRKTTRYNSQDVLSGLLFCAECGASYRRITRSSGEIVWRCANRVEHGKEICKDSPTIRESDIIAFICETMNIPKYDPQVVKNLLTAIKIDHNGRMSSEFRQRQTMSFSMQFNLDRYIYD